MSDITILDPQAEQQAPAGTAQAPCQECLGCGGWFRYEPALESAAGRLHLSCLQCRGSGRMALAGA